MLIPAATRISGELEFAGDKSISHRLILLSLLNRGQFAITGLSDCRDVNSSLKAVKQLGVKVSASNGVTLLQNPGVQSRHGYFSIDCGNSGTTVRLLSGILAGQPGFYQLYGDESLSRRPMQRVVEPLFAMNANISASESKLLPIEISGSRYLRAIDFNNQSGSAQVKSAVMMAALQAVGETAIFEQFPGRDHSERLFSQLNLPLKMVQGGIRVKGPAELSGNHNFVVPGDVSSAAFFVIAASIVPDSELKLKNILLNPTRTGFIQVLKRMGASIKATMRHEKWEPAGDILVSSASLTATNIEVDEIPGLIDELPVLAVAMAYASGTSRVTGARELRHKETDRIRDLVGQLQIAGVNCREFSDGFEITGPTRINEKLTLDSCNDHRLAMSFAVLALNSNYGLEIKNSDCIDVSFPDFIKTLNKCL